ncbi:MAG: DUF1643 domain-containing protein [Yoonia sp.]|uniref:DUF1643 domain-containing protein n=1 Tax=Yoonia sp. TaxID=2212373 RepID=UPI00326308D0
MITRHHSDGATLSSATYSDCETYRYALTRTWDDTGKRLMFVMLNPSKATEAHNDPTVGRCENRARALGYGAFRVTNLFALRETDPMQMRRHIEPNGPDNDQTLIEGADWADTTIAAWGVHGVHLGRDAEIITLFQNNNCALHALGVTKAGHPRHPLYMPYSAMPAPWPA